MDQSKKFSSRHQLGSKHRIVVDDGSSECRVGAILRNRWLMNNNHPGGGGGNHNYQSNLGTRMPAICGSSQSLASISYKLSRSGSGDNNTNNAAAAGECSSSGGYSGFLPLADFSYQLPMSGFALKNKKCLNAANDDMYVAEEFKGTPASSFRDNGSNISIQLEVPAPIRGNHSNAIPMSAGIRHNKGEHNQNKRTGYQKKKKLIRNGSMPIRTDPGTGTGTAGNAANTTSIAYHEASLSEKDKESSEVSMNQMMMSQSQKQQAQQHEQQQQQLLQKSQASRVFSKTKGESNESEIAQPVCLFERLGVQSSHFSIGKGLALLFNIHKFVRSIKKVGTNKFKEVSKQQFSLIGDRAASYDVYFFSKVFNTIPTCTQFFIHRIQGLTSYSSSYASIVRLLSSNRFIATPNSSMSTAFNFLMLVSIMRILFSVPIFFCLNYETTSSFEGELFPLLNILTQLCFIFHIVLKFNTAVYLRGELVTSRRIIAQQYIRSFDFVIDIMSCVIISYCSQSGFNSSVSLLLLLKLKELQAITQQLELKYQLKGKEQAFFELVKLVLLILFIAHIIACGALFIAKIQSPSQSLSAASTNATPRAWFSAYMDDDWFILYINAVYWSIVTMVTLGYGDIIPISTIDKGYVIWVALVGCFVLSYSMNSIGDIVRGFAKAEKELKEKMLALNHYFSSRELQQDMQLRVIKYYQYLHSQQHEADNTGYQLIRCLPHRLKQEVMSSLYLSLLTSKKLFSLNFSRQFLAKLALRMQEEIYSPDQIIFTAHSNINRIYFLLSGQAEIFVDQSEKSRIIPVIQLKNKTDILGEYEFFSGLQTQLSARAQTVTNLAFLTKSDFYEVLNEFPLDKERFLMMQDQCALLQTPRLGVVVCYACKSYRHRLAECPYILFQAPREKAISEFQRNTPTLLRMPCSRRQEKSGKAILFQIDAETIAYAVQQIVIPTQSNIKISLLDTSQQIIGIPESNQLIHTKNSIALQNQHHHIYPTQQQPYSKQLSSFAKDRKKRTLVFKQQEVPSPLLRRKEQKTLTNITVNHSSKSNNNNNNTTNNGTIYNVSNTNNAATFSVMCNQDRIAADSENDSRSQFTRIKSPSYNNSSCCNNYNNNQSIFTSQLGNNSGTAPIPPPFSPPNQSSFPELETTKIMRQLSLGKRSLHQMTPLFMTEDSAAPLPIPTPTSSKNPEQQSRQPSPHTLHSGSPPILAIPNVAGSQIVGGILHSDEKAKSGIPLHEERRSSIMSLHQYGSLVEGNLTADYLMNRFSTRISKKGVSQTSIDTLGGPANGMAGGAISQHFANNLNNGEQSPSISIAKGLSTKAVLSQKTQQPFGIINFDKSEEFEVYFPHNNRKNVLDAIAAVTRKMRKSLKRPLSKSNRVSSTHHSKQINKQEFQMTGSSGYKQAKNAKHCRFSDKPKSNNNSQSINPQVKPSAIQDEVVRFSEKEEEKDQKKNERMLEERAVEDVEVEIEGGGDACDQVSLNVSNIHDSSRLPMNNRNNDAHEGEQECVVIDHLSAISNLDEVLPPRFSRMKSD